MRREKTRAERAPTFEATLLDLIQLADGASRESKAERRTANPVVEQVTSTDASPQSRLRQVLESLEPEATLKVRTLMIAGRDRRDVTTIPLDATLGEPEEALIAAARDASENGSLLADYLRRGYALACASAIALEKPIALWAPNHAATLEERAWLSFGRQLATSEPEDWQFFGRVEPGGRQIIRLYVRLPEHAWWSFQALLDRPSSASVSKETRALTARRTKGVMASSLRALATRLRIPPVPAGNGSVSVSSKRSPVRQGNALRRAARAILARVGDHGIPSTA
jgi:hypothetical protein